MDTFHMICIEKLCLVLKNLWIKESLQSLTKLIYWSSWKKYPSVHAFTAAVIRTKDDSVFSTNKRNLSVQHIPWYGLNTRRFEPLNKYFLLNSIYGTYLQVNILYLLCFLQRHKSTIMISFRYTKIKRIWFFDEIFSFFNFVSNSLS